MAPAREAPAVGRDLCLPLWIDANHNGISEPLEMQTVADSLAEIGLGYQVHNRKDGRGNRFVFLGWASI